MEIKIKYILDNENWSNGEYEDAQYTENNFIITKEMIKNLIHNHVPLEKDTYVDYLYVVNSF